MQRRKEVIYDLFHIVTLMNICIKNNIHEYFERDYIYNQIKVLKTI